MSYNKSISAVQIQARESFVQMIASAMKKAKENITLIVNTAIRADYRTIDEIGKVLKVGMERIKTALQNAETRK